ncbi:MAG: tRNA pseudouridine(38-40) synthase TruA [Oscillospiraceae bacterium]|nr:tRNA pseudouridine(38-40) synthase TruA [Oscillospiraceae bacterium]
MRNLLIYLRYDGRAFHGWKVQKNAPTVMETFQDALEAVLGERPDVKGCSRTDSGVHAKMYAVSFKTENRIPCQGLVKALNTKLPETIAATACREVDDDFHARYSSNGKRYVYRILNSELRDPFCEGFVCRIPQHLDEKLMHDEAQSFVGTHDFKSFQNTGTDIEDTVRTMYAASVERKGDMIEFSVSGDGFLYNMVRIMAGTLIDIARGTIKRGSIPDILSALDRETAGFTAPACGLMLDEVFYDFEKEGEEQI